MNREKLAQSWRNPFPNLQQLFGKRGTVILHRFDRDLAETSGITRPDQVVVMFHCGSRGFGREERRISSKCSNSGRNA
ncbi:MAG: RtcB family protein [Microcoleus sp. SIO2G3]|nr:RtcB family protein [Microcoleus sp. SIO2G3]